MTATSDWFLNIMRHGQAYILYREGFLPAPMKYIRSPRELGLVYTNQQITTSDSIRLHCYLLRYSDQVEACARAAAGTVIMFAGRDNFGKRVKAAREFIRLRCNVFMLTYRGYGQSEGVPSEAGLCLDAQAAVDFVRGDPELSEPPLILYGNSLGGAVAIHCASACTTPTTTPTSTNTPHIQAPVAALILENTFLSLPLIVRTHRYLGYLWFLCTEKWDSARKVARLPAELPILMLSGEKDEVVPAAHMRELWGIAQRRGAGAGADVGRDRFVSFPEGTHSRMYAWPEYWSAITDFLEPVLNPGPRPPPSPPPSTAVKFGRKRHREFRVVRV
ncbi:Hydrolase-4 domain-containing protein [Mycena kentingensis (nom. inval.)]|nr:Hydrolase-4 domain-containing protein [Mycena kentingensis (nom. inval.)]